MNKNKKRIFLKILTIIISIAIVLVVLYEFYPLMKNISTAQGRIEFKEKIQTMGFKGMAILFLLESAQIVFIVLPGEPIEVLYGMCYGSIGGAVLLTLDVFINTLFVYWLVKKFGRKVLVFFFSEEKTKKIENSKLLENKEKIENLLILLFFIPGTPKDLLLYIGPMLEIDWKKFILISTFVRFPSVITSTIAGANIISGNIFMIFGIYVITAIPIIAIMMIQKNKNKKEKNQNSEIIKELMKI